MAEQTFGQRDPSAVPLEKFRALEAERDALRAAEKEVSDAYLRVREMLGAYDTNPGGTDRYEVTENAIKALQLRVAALEAALRGAKVHLDAYIDPRHESGMTADQGLCVASDECHAVLRGDTTALRALLVEAVYDTAKEWDDYGSPDETLRAWAEKQVDKRLGASKEGK